MLLGIPRKVGEKWRADVRGGAPADYCHKMGVANRDIKLENTLLDGSPKPLVKITDFGYCKSDQESLAKSKVGTPGYTGGYPCGCTKHSGMMR